ncbi:hypothetical protein I8D64_01735 [Brachybacterium sp. MASK1Z-5]|uniref:Uncharacterized protein n=1 Tax=Brachybacterium halotolerans TaxID=2795215 RepID=A0ABS1B657_9MICO|nr:hypothetical protein [Brachybacterium halotolerans]MBK0330124.1 hypothetical protein [Brachybacterium halotolerans]
MSTSSKTQKSKTPSAADAAHQSLAEAEDALAAVAAEVDKLEGERDQILADIEAGSILADVERLSELEEEHLPRKHERLEHLERVKGIAEQSITALELASLGADGAGSLPAAWDRFTHDRSLAEEKILAGIEELKSATDEWSTAYNSIATKARAVGLVEGVTDPLHRVQVRVARPYDSHSGNITAVLADGDEYRDQSASTVVGDVVSKGDAGVRRHIAQSREADYLGQAWR